ncbi:MAG: hypothetical protein AB1490_04225 [Pseudomonadota bacterium]
MSRPLFRPSRYKWIWLAVSAGAALAFAFYLRFRVLEVPAVSIACESGDEAWHCMARKAVIAMFTPMAFGGAALVAAVLNMIHPSIVLSTLIVVAGGLGIVFYNAALSALAFALFILSLARPLPEAE